ncbi:hypothetical protein [Fundidesulfovibrio magnetotacticus]|uniref:hypothetical protein n=1 Tax=Fundidesulfovibrio magnetotacticus TaxID=2730080 RepID=UPI0015635BFC|nr:hypothetical protein [Fundidesulfovibrio magnetotacticus]
MLPLVLALGWHAALGQQDPAGQRLASLSDQGQNQRPPEPDEELSALRATFQDEVRKPTLERIDRYKKLWSKSPKLQDILEERRQRLLSLGERYFDFVRRDVAAQMARSGLRFDGTQFFAYADRNPKAQFIVVGLYDARSERIDILGADLISSGNIEKGGDYFETPIGVFENLLDNFSYRAQGTPNQEGWRGLGAKDSRVWDFGYQRGLKKYKDGNTMSQLRLLMHSTDPERGEPRLGRTDSKGCVRISAGLNRFLDTHAILDSHYEQWAKSRPDSWLFKKERKPTAYPGKYLIIGDSSQSALAVGKP